MSQPNQVYADDVTKDDKFAQAVLALFDDLKSKDYDHCSPTEETVGHALSKRRAAKKPDPLYAETVHDVWGWSLPARKDFLSLLHDRKLLDILIDAGLLIPEKEDSDVLKATVRVSCMYPFGEWPNYYVHSSWPLVDADIVYFGPDSYRFTRYMDLFAHRIKNCQVAIDVCSGAGVGAFHLVKLFPNARVFSLDINPKAIAYGHINATHLGRDIGGRVEFRLSDSMTAVQEHQGQVDLVTINPPFVAGDTRLYAGGGPTGKELTMKLLEDARKVMKDGAELWCHVAAPVSFTGKDMFLEEMKQVRGWEIVSYDVIDVDILGEDMAPPEKYPGVARLASVNMALKKIKA